MKLKLKPVNQQVIVVTGASSGIGLVTARMAARQGASVVLAARNEEAIRQATEMINQSGGSAIYVRADVGVEEDVWKIVSETVARFGRIDTWVNNAGISIFGETDKVSIADMRRMFETNFWGTVYGSRAAAAQLKKQQTPGAIINIGSVFGNRATVLQSTYSASKFGHHGWTVAMRMELEKEGAPVSVTLIHPGRIDTPYNEHAASYLEKQPSHRGMLYPPEAVAEAIVYAAEHPIRDIKVGLQVKLFTVLASLAPRLVDKFVELYMYPMQQSKSRLSHNGSGALYQPGYGLHERGTHEGWVRKRSYYVKAAKYPVFTALAVAGLAALAYGSLQKQVK